MSAPPIGLAAAKAPPFRLPGEHFAAALCFFVVGTLAVIAIAPLLAAGGYAAPQVIGVTHLFTLGWITTSIMGALYQFLPVALGEPIRSVRAGHVAFALHVPGVALFVGGMVAGSTPVMLAGAAAFGTALTLFVVNLGLTLARGTRRDVTWWALAGATCFLTVTVALGLTLASNREWGFLGGARLLALVVHLHVALAGWVLLVIVGVAQRLLPMFLLSHGVSDRFARIAVGGLAGGALVLTVGHHGPPLLSRWLPAFLLLSGVGAFLLQARAFYRKRHRPDLDPGMRSAAVALALLATAPVLGVVAVFLAPTPVAWTGYLVVTLLAISSFIAALYFKIVPFLVWFHRFGPLVGKRTVARVSDLFTARQATLAGTLLATGTVVLGVAVFAENALAARLGGTTLAGGAIVESLQMLALARRTP